MSEIAYLHVVSQFELTFILQLTHDALHQCGFTLTITSYEGYLIATLHSEVYSAEYLFIIERHCHITHLHWVSTASWTWRKLKSKVTGIFFIHLYELKLFEHLHSTLHLEGLGIRSFEAFDEILRLSYHLLLFLILLHLLFATFLTQFQIMAVCGFIVVDSAHRHLNGTSGNIIHEFTVVADYDHGFRTITDEIFEPTDGFYVEMVCWLVKKQYVRRFEKQLGKLDTHTPTSRELTGRTVEIRALKTESEQCLLHIFLEMRHVYGIEFL